MDPQRVRVDSGRTLQNRLYHRGDGLFYVIQEVRGRRARLRCHKYYSGCRGTGVIRLGTQHLEHLRPHNHGRDMLLIEDSHMRRQIIADAAQNVRGRTAGQILLHWRTSCRNPHLAMRFTTARMRTALDRARSNNYPGIPRSLMSLGLLLGLPNMRAVCETSDRNDLIFRRMVGYIADRTVCLVFISGRMLQYLQDRPNIHVDGTFKKRPRVPQCSQILNVVTNHGGTVIGILRALMTSRTEAAYLTLFQYVKELAPNLQPRRIHCDFELGQMNALKTVFPAPTDVVGCQWHYSKAASAMARSVGLVPLATAHEEVYAFIRCLCAVPLLPSHMIWEGVLQLWREVIESPWTEQLLPLFEYFSRVWKPRIGELSVFGSPERTNNCSESDNRSMAAVLPQNYPSVWQVIGGFVKMEYLAWLDKLASVDGRLVTRSRRYSAIWNDARIGRLAAQLENGELTPLQFLHAVSWHIVAAVQYGMELHDTSDSESEED